MIFNIQNNQLVKPSIMVFSTDLGTKKRINILKSIFRDFYYISKWTVDMEDVDNVLRIEALGHLVEYDIINTLNKHGIYCISLPE